MFIIKLFCCKTSLWYIPYFIELEMSDCSCLNHELITVGKTLFLFGLQPRILTYNWLKASMNNKNENKSAGLGSEGIWLTSMTDKPIIMD